MVNSTFRFTRAATGIAALCLLVLAGCSSSEDRARSHYERGVELAAKGEPAKAVLEFRNALKFKSDYPEAEYALGEAEERQGHFENALKYYLGVAEALPSHLEVRVKLANILAAAGRTDDATKYADEAYALDPNKPAVLIAKAAVEFRRGNRDEAVALAQQALKLDPGYQDAMIVLAADRLRSGDAKGMLEFLEKAPESSDNQVLQLLRLTALEMLGDPEGVEKLFVKLIQLFPDTPAFEDGLIKWYVSKGRTDDAEKALRASAAARPDDPKSVGRLIDFLARDKGSDAAIAELERLVAAGTGAGGDLGFKLRLTLAQMQFTAGDHPKAIAGIQSIVSSTEGANRNMARIALAKMMAADRDLSGAAKVIDEVIAEDAKNAEALGVRASIRLADGKGDEATDDLLAAINEAPQDARLRELLAEAYERAGKAALAEDQYAKALALNDNPGQSGLLLARFLLRYGNVVKARQVLEDVATRAPEDRQVLSLLGELRLSAQDWIGAEQIADKLRALAEDKKDAAADRLTAQALSGLDRHSESIDLLKSSLADSADPDASLAGLVRAYLQAGQLQEAEAYLKSRLAEDPKNSRVMVLLGSIYASTQRPDQAEATFKAAEAVDETSLGSIALAQFYVVNNRLEDAEKVARAGLERDNKADALRYLLVSIMQRTERFPEAIAMYEEMFKANPDSPVIANDLASLLSERQGDQASIDRAFEIAQRFANSEIPQYSDTLGWIYYLKGDYVSALPLVKSAAEKLPTVGLIQYHLGMVQKELGQSVESVASLEKALTLQASMAAADIEKARAAIAEQSKSKNSGVSN